jgi:hypothetical protein
MDYPSVIAFTSQVPLSHRGRIVLAACMKLATDHPWFDPINFNKVWNRTEISSGRRAGANPRVATEAAGNRVLSNIKTEFASTLFDNRHRVCIFG